MKPLEILTTLASSAGGTRTLPSLPDAILDSPAFAMPCRLGEEQVVLRPVSVVPEKSEMLALSVAFAEEPHVLRIARSPRFQELEKIWESLADVPEPLLLALVEKELGSLFQLLENAVRRQLKLIGIAAPDSSDARTLFAQVADITFSLTRSATVTAAIGNIRNLDLAHETIRSVKLPALTEYAAFSLTLTELSGLSIGDVVLVPEIATVPARIVVDGRFVVDSNGVSRYNAGDLVHVFDATAKDITLGEMFDAAEAPRILEATPSGPLTLIVGGRTVSAGRLDRLGDQTAFVVETPKS